MEELFFCGFPSGFRVNKLTLIDFYVFKENQSSTSSKGEPQVPRGGDYYIFVYCILFPEISVRHD